ncbi:MAG TPA: hypothetical protein VER96_23355 [Polyangiaceae bacterium]|nr:hypothetical protein [Polyangiaceae bacterium]
MKPARVVAVMFWALVLIAHGAAAVAALLLLPGGFPFAHARMVANRVLPLFAIANVLVVFAGVLRRSRAVPASLLLFPAAWFGVALAARAAFPESGNKVALSALVLALLFALGLVDFWPRVRPSRVAWAWALLGAASGAVFVIVQRAPAPSTRPALTELLPGPIAAQPMSAADARESIALAPWLQVDSRPERVTLRAGKVSIVVEPRLTFDSRSPDGFWTVFAPVRAVPAVPIIRVERTDSSVQWQDAQGGTLQVAVSSGGSARIEAQTLLEKTVFSHLNAYSAVSIRGHERLGLRFSPCPASVVEVTHSDYPFGAPARLAYLDASGTFRVVQASDAEKGPFTTLAEGPLARGEPLQVELVEMADSAKRTLSTIVFRDWSLQVSTELSPTAGWGLPQNAFEFGLESHDSSSPAYLDLTLAGTSVGRGWDSVGHGPGVYTNHMEIVPPPE